jgi:hypothetical protein
LQEDEQIGDELMLAKTPLIFVSPVVSPGWSKMGISVITTMMITVIQNLEDSHSFTGDDFS